MTQNELIENLYHQFSSVERPDHFTNYTHCEECREHDETMRSATLSTLTGKHLGSLGWNPLSFLTTQGFAYYMPRLVELLLLEETDKNGEPFAETFLYHLSPTGDFDRFSEYSLSQCQSILEALRFYKVSSTSDKHEEQSIEEAIMYWQSRVNGIPSRADEAASE